MSDAIKDTTATINQPTVVVSWQQVLTDSLTNYLDHIDGVAVTNLYDLVVSEVEEPLIQQTLDFTNGNQTKTAQILGINRGTLRKKMKRFGLIKQR